MMTNFSLLDGLDVGTYVERCTVRTDSGYRPVRWNEIGYQHLAYFDDGEDCWKPVPGREAELEALRRRGE